MSEAEAAPMSALAPASDSAPLHSRAFRARRLANWFPLGLSYATLYMGRYNFNVSKDTIGELHHLDKAQMGIIATAGFWVYGMSVLVNGPLADRLGGRRAILTGTLGACVLNMAIALSIRSGWWDARLVASMSVLYAINMYFQSFGALSVVKVNSAWFHVRERGVLGGFFGSMISLGYFFALSIGGIILANLPLWTVYAIPSGVILVMFAVDFLLVKDRPSHAGHEDFATGDEGSDAADAHGGEREREREREREEKVPFGTIVMRVLKNPVMRTLAVAEFCTGLVRQGLLLYYGEFLKEVHGLGKMSFDYQLASTGITAGGIAGALACGFLSDRLFQSRRAPVAFIFYIGQIVSLLALGWVTSARAAAIMVPVCAMWIFGVHGLLSGTASMDFGGKKAAATAAGLLDGVQYIGAGLTGIGLGSLIVRYHWPIWTYAIVPFSAIGALLMLRLWNARPAPKGAH
jgi:OPA family glycerol-3-phosphate transporter-like MFS transporter